MDKNLKKLLKTSPNLAKDYLRLILENREALNNSDLSVNIVSSDESGLCLVTELQDGTKQSVEIWANEKFDQVLHLSSPITEVDSVDLNESRLLRQNWGFGIERDKANKKLAVVHALYTEADYAIFSVISAAGLLAGAAAGAIKFLSHEKGLKSER